MLQRLPIFTVSLLILLAAINAHAESEDQDELTIANIDAHLQALEDQFDDIIEDTEKKVRWYANNKRKRAFSIVYLHGFSASRQEINPLPKRLAVKLKANIYFTRLRGHGRTADAMLEGNVASWKEEALNALKIGELLGDKVIIIGTSTGATLAAWLNAQPQAKNVAATISISPNFGVKSKTASLAQSKFGLWLAKKINGDYYSFAPINEFHARYWTERYPLEAVVPMLDLVDEVQSLDKSRITTPQLIVYSPNDQVVDVQDIRETAVKMTGTSVTITPFTISKDPAQHVLVGELSSLSEVDDLLKLILGFLKQVDITTPGRN